MTPRCALSIASALAALGCAGGPRPAPAPPASATPSAVVAAPSLDAGASAPRAFDPAPWLEDLRFLIAELSSHYANLDFAVRVRRMDLARLKQRAEARIAAATSDDQARRAFQSFLKAFGDGHLGVQWSKPPAPAANDAGPLCRRLGYEAADPGGVDFALAAGFTRIQDADSDDVPGGILSVPGGGKLGVVRIGVFEESAHPKLCEAARGALGLANDARCDEACADRLERAVSNLLTAALERRATSLARAGAAALAVDITGNGGGTSWFDPAARVLTRARIEQRDFAVVRHPHWVSQLSETLRHLESDLATHGEIDHGVLAPAIATLKAEITEVSTPCDESALWVEGQPKPSCEHLVRIAPALRYAKPGALAGRGAAADLFGASGYDYHEGVNALPLVVLVDGGTASAAEGFAEALQDSRAALIVGSQTYGAGCGFTNGGIRTVLPRSGASVGIPDCVRLRADGSNAVAGVAPDVALPLLDRDSPYQRARKVVAGLRSSWPALLARLTPR